MSVDMNKKPKVRSGRIVRIFRLPIGLHEKIKESAKRSNLTISAFYDEIIDSFVKENLSSRGPAEYLYPSGETKHNNIPLKEEVVFKVKTLANRDTVPENRVLFTAVMQFVKKLNTDS